MTESGLAPRISRTPPDPRGSCVLGNLRALRDDAPGLMTECVHALFDPWGRYAASGQTFDLVTEMMRLAFDIVGQFLMSAQISADMDATEKVVKVASDWTCRRLQARIKLALRWPTARNWRVLQAERVLDGVVSRTVETHREEQGSDTVLTCLMAAIDDETGVKMEGRQLRDEVLALLLAGHETTGSAWICTLTPLARHPEVERRLQAEVGRVLDAYTVGKAELRQLAYAGQVIDESMRLYPPAWSFTCWAVEEDELGGYSISKGAVVVIRPFVNHHEPRFWPELARFDSENCAPDAPKALPCDYFPFGGGPHLGIRKYLTWYEVKLALCLLAKRYFVALVHATIVAMAPSFSLRPSSAIPACVSRR